MPSTLFLTFFLTFSIFAMTSSLAVSCSKKWSRNGEPKVRDASRSAGYEGEESFTHLLYDLIHHLDSSPVDLGLKLLEILDLEASILLSIFEGSARLRRKRGGQRREPTSLLFLSEARNETHPDNSLNGAVIATAFLCS